MSFFNRIANLFGPKQENRTIDTDGLVLKKDIKVSELKIQFNERFGSVLRVYSGRSQVSNDITLSEAGLTNEGVFNCRGNMLVGNFINKMMEDYGLKVKVFTCDEWVAVLDGLTLSASGIIKKNAVKADMEAMLSGDNAKPEGVTPVSEAKIGVFAVIKNSDGSYSVTIDGMYCANSKSAMRQIADALEFKYEAEWTTRQFGAKLSDYMNKCASEMQMAPVSASTVEKESVKAEKEAEAEKSAIEAHAELERIKAEAEAAKKAAEAEVKRLQEEAEKAKAEAAEMKAKQEASVAKALLQQEQKQLKQLQAQAQRGNTAAATGSYTTTNYTSVIENASGSDMGKRLAKYACQYIGNPYVAGGTSLTNGADCSGFTFRIYSDFGYSIPRTSYEQRSCGTGVDYSSAQPGDLICYDGHVAMYIGGGLIVHASTQRTGIKVSNANYRPILAVRRVV